MEYIQNSWVLLLAVLSLFQGVSSVCLDDPHGQCAGSGWRLAAGDQCVLVPKDKANFPDANLECMSMGGRLVVVAELSPEARQCLLEQHPHHKYRMVWVVGNKQCTLHDLANPKKNRTPGCNKKRFYACEKVAMPVTAPTTTTTTTTTTTPTTTMTTTTTTPTTTTTMPPTTTTTLAPTTTTLRSTSPDMETTMEHEWRTHQSTYDTRTDVGTQSTSDYDSFGMTTVDSMDTTSDYTHDETSQGRFTMDYRDYTDETTTPKTTPPSTYPPDFYTTDMMVENITMFMNMVSEETSTSDPDSDTTEPEPGYESESNDKVEGGKSEPGTSEKVEVIPTAKQVGLQTPECSLPQKLADCEDGWFSMSSDLCLMLNVDTVVDSVQAKSECVEKGGMLLPKDKMSEQLKGCFMDRFKTTDHRAKTVRLAEGKCLKFTDMSVMDCPSEPQNLGYLCGIDKSAKTGGSKDAASHLTGSYIIVTTVAFTISHILMGRLSS